MKKVFSFLVLLLVFGMFFPFMSVSAAETQVDVDQSHLPSTGSSVVISNYGWSQTFTPGLNNTSDPDINRLSSVHINTRNEVAGDWIEITIMDNVTGQYVVNGQGQRMGGDEDWESFYFVPKKQIVAGNEHTLYVTVSNSTTMWVWNTTPGYDGGVRKQNDTQFSGDFAFMTWGNTYTADVVVEDPLADEEDTTPPPEEDTVTPGSDSDNVVQADDSKEDTQQKAAPKVVEESDEIDPPEITRILMNDEELKVSEIGTLVVQDNDSILVQGTGPLSTIIKLSVGDISYEVSVDANGEWEFTLPVEDFAMGEYKLVAQTVLDDKGSAKVDVFEFSKVGAEDIVVLNTELDSANMEESGTSILVYIGLVAGVLLLVLILILVLLYYKSTKFREMLVGTKEKVDEMMHDDNQKSAMSDDVVK